MSTGKLPAGTCSYCTVPVAPGRGSQPVCTGRGRQQRAQLLRAIYGALGRHRAIAGGLGGSRRVGVAGSGLPVQVRSEAGQVKS